MLERCENDDGYIYYCNRSGGRVEKEDPKLTFAINKINDDFNCVKYSQYRCAQKLDALKTVLMTTKIPFHMVTAILEHHQLVQVDTSPSIKPIQLTSVVFDVFYAAEKLGMFDDFPEFELQSACAMIATFLWNIFDPHRTTPISLLDLKQTLLLLCKTTVCDEIVFEHFLLLADHNRCVSRIRFESMLKIHARIFNYLGETELIFQPATIMEIVTDCYEDSPGIVGLNEYQFNGLWKLSARGDGFEGYARIFTLANRIRNASDVLHDAAKCVCCQIAPIRGLLFKCQRCKGVSLCLKCFSVGFTTQSHDNSHKMLEISQSVYKPNKFKSVLMKICHLFSSNSLDTCPDTDAMDSHLIVDTGCADDLELESIVSSPRRQIRADSIINSSSGSFLNNNRRELGDANNLMDSLQSVIELLNKQNVAIKGNLTSHRQLMDFIRFMEGHSKVLGEQIDQLRNIYTKSQSVLLPPSSTPLRNVSRRTLKDINEVSSPLSQSLYGAEINQTFLERNRSDLSIRDISAWFATNGRNHCHRKSLPQSQGPKTLYHNENNTILETDYFSVETQMTNFKFLLWKVKEIVDGNLN